jgi:tripartite-type tricarboxylate transporter receptor subunit TctC
MIPRALSAFRAMLGLMLIASTIGVAQPLSAQGFPTQTITFQVAFAAGGIADVVARLVAQRLSERLAHTVVVENRGGAGGNLAAKAVSGAAPDGHTILVTTTSLAVNETATRNKGFSADDLRAIAIVAFSPDVFAVHPSNPAKDLREFINSGKSFTYGSAGVGTGPHIGAEYFFREVAKVQALHVPFAGGGRGRRQPCRCDRADAADGCASHHPGAPPRHWAGEPDAQFRRAGCADLR